MTSVFLHACIQHLGEFNANIELLIKKEMNGQQNSIILPLTFDRVEIPPTFPSALLGGLLIVLQNTERNVPLLISSSSDFLLRALVKERLKFENDMLDPRFRLLKAVFAALNERVARVQFKKVSDNEIKFSPNE